LIGFVVKKNVQKKLFLTKNIVLFNQRSFLTPALIMAIIVQPTDSGATLFPDQVFVITMNLGGGHEIAGAEKKQFFKPFIYY